MVTVFIACLDSVSRMDNFYLSLILSSVGIASPSKRYRYLTRRAGCEKSAESVSRWDPEHLSAFVGICAREIAVQRSRLFRSAQSENCNYRQASWRPRSSRRLGGPLLKLDMGLVGRVGFRYVFAPFPTTTTLTNRGRISHEFNGYFRGP